MGVGDESGWKELCGCCVDDVPSGAVAEGVEGISVGTGRSTKEDEFEWADGKIEVSVKESVDE